MSYADRAWLIRDGRVERSIRIGFKEPPQYLELPIREPRGGYRLTEPNLYSAGPIRTRTYMRRRRWRRCGEGGFEISPTLFYFHGDPLEPAPRPRRRR